MISSKRDLRELYKFVDCDTKNPTIWSLLNDKTKFNINYTPDYQRNYVWSIEKATRLIETILINGEIPPITVTEINGIIEIIDGRQRFESILKFYNNKLRLKRSGLNILKNLEGCTYKTLPKNIRERFEDYKIKMIVYKFKFGQQYPVECEDLLKRDLFRRYNSGMTSLSNNEVARASYAYDKLTNLLMEKINEARISKDPQNIYNKFVNVFIPKTKRKIIERELTNLQLVNIRELLTINYIPIINSKSVSFSSDTIDTFYHNFVSKEDLNKLIEEFETIAKTLFGIYENLFLTENNIVNNILFFKATYWMLTILYKYYAKQFYDFDINKFCNYINKKEKINEIFSYYKSMTSENIIIRYEFMKEYLNNKLNICIDNYINDINEKKDILKRRPKKVLKNNVDTFDISFIQNIPIKETKFSIYEIIEGIKKSKFFIRPFYQREEVSNKSIASKIIESIILGIKLPPIYIHSKINNEGITIYEVIDGQQRIISALSYLDEFINDCDGNIRKAKKGKFKLTNLRNSQFINNKNVDEIGLLKHKILNYELETLEIQENININFDPVDMFLRLNSKPYPILYNSFEMWNSFDCTEILEKIKKLSNQYGNELFKQSRKKMKNEELITTLAYMDYKNVTLKNITDFFKVYVYYKDNEIKISFDKKGAVTALLENIAENEDTTNKFLKSIQNLESFIKKIKILINENYDILPKILNPYTKNSKKITAKDFYLLYIILQDLNIHIIETYKIEILTDIEKIYKYMKKVPENINGADFIDFTKNIIQKHKK